MLAVEFTFLAGRYHATPFGRHVNEAEVEWPPAPWRILRALIATWHRKAEERDFPESLLEELIDRLASEVPVYALPPATRAHTRHYMPVREGSKDKPVLVFDAFARVDPTHPLVVIWREVEMTAQEVELLDVLLGGLGYLGRGESWVEARRLPHWTGHANCLPSELEVDPASGELREPIQLLVPRAPSAYQVWREQTLASIEWNRLTAKPRKQLEATLPMRLIDALRIESADVKQAGWSLPPGGAFVIYQRPYGTFSRTPTPSRTVSGEVTTVRLAVFGKPLPRIEDAVRVGELVRAALMATSERILGSAPPVFSGHGLPASNKHGHAFFLPQDVDNDGRIDHITIHAEMGLGEVLPVFEALSRLYMPGGSEWKVVVDAYGMRDSFEDGLILPSTRWVSVTPYLHPWHRKRGFGYEEQILRECRQRGLPEPKVTRIAELDIGRGVRRRTVHFHRFRNRPGLQQPDTRGGFFRLVFQEPVRGPIAFGFGCHYGLGLFRSEARG